MTAEEQIIAEQERIHRQAIEQRKEMTLIETIEAIEVQASAADKKATETFINATNLIEVGRAMTELREIARTNIPALCKALKEATICLAAFGEDYRAARFCLARIAELLKEAE